MRFLLVIFFSIFIYANDLVDLVNEFNDVNLKINSLQSLVSDKEEENTQNANKVKEELNEYKNAKYQILSILPTLLNDECLNQDLLKQYNPKKHKLNHLFYSKLIEVNDLFKSKDFNKDKLKLSIESAIKEINQLKLKDAEAVLQGSFIEILTYLRLNQTTIKNSYFFKSYSTKEIILFLNSHFSPKILAFINPAKIIMCIAILVIAFALRKLILKIIFTLLLKILKKENDERLINLLSNITKPILFLFYIYALYFCVFTYYYPKAMLPSYVNLFNISHTVIFTWLLLNILDDYGLMLMSKIALKSGKKEILNLIMKMLYSIFILIAFLIILAQAGFDISTIVASLGIGGLAVALAAKDILANFFASIILLFDSAYSQGDWIEVDGVEGLIVETGLRKTTIRSFDNSLIFIPNSHILNGYVKNQSKRKFGRLVRLKLRLSYLAKVSDIENLMQDIKDYLNTNELVSHDEQSLISRHYKNHYKQELISLKDLEGIRTNVFVWLNEFDESSINLELYFYTKSTDGQVHREAKSEIILKIMELVAKNNLNFALPKQEILLKEVL